MGKSQSVGWVRRGGHGFHRLQRAAADRRPPGGGVLPFEQAYRDSGAGLTGFAVWMPGSSPARIDMRGSKFATWKREGAPWYASNEVVGLGRVVPSSSDPHEFGPFLTI